MTTINLGWEYDGVDLSTYAYDVRALGAPEQVPARRGDNVVIPGATGRLYVDKRLDQRTLALAMYIDARHPTSGSSTRTAAQLKANLDALKGLFARDGQHTLRCALPGLETRDATAEVVNVVEFQPTGPYSYALMVEFVLTDPWWYSQSTTTVGPTTIIQSPQNIAVTNDGTYKAEKVTVTVAGPITDPKFAVGSIWVLYTGTVATDETLVIDCGDWTAELDGGDVSGNISHEGDLRWLVFAVGVNTLIVTSSGFAGATTVTVEFTAAFV